MTLDENSVHNLEQRSREADQAGFSKLKQGLDVDGKRSCSSRNTKDGGGKLLLNPTLTRERWAGWFHFFSTFIDPNMDGHVKLCPVCVPPDDIPSMVELEEAVREMT